MYTPESFALRDRAACHALIQAHGFGALVTVGPEGAPVATHLPFVLDAGRGPNGTLIAHMARANPQWEQLASGKLGLAIFGGPHAYVSPAWYRVQPSVPTWNYLAVHAYGIPVLIEEPAMARDALRRLVEASEASIGSDWRMESLNAVYRDSMVEQIVAFEIPIQRMEGKAKLGQNRTLDDRAAVIARLAGSPDPMARAVAEAMRQVLSDEGVKDL